MESKPGPTDVTDFGDLLEDQDFSQVVYFNTLDHAHKIDFTWIIHKFSTFTDSIYSREFSLADTCDAKFKASLTSSTSSRNTSKLDMNMIKTDNRSPKVQVESQLTMGNSEGKMICETKTRGVLSTVGDNFMILSAPHPLKSVMKKHRIDLPGDRLFINGKLKISHCCIITSRMSGKPSSSFIPRPNERIEKCIIESFPGDIED